MKKALIVFALFLIQIVKAQQQAPAYPRTRAAVTRPSRESMKRSTDSAAGLPCTARQFTAVLHTCSATLAG